MIDKNKLNNSEVYFFLPGLGLKGDRSSSVGGDKKVVSMTGDIDGLVKMTISLRWSVQDFVNDLKSMGYHISGFELLFPSEVNCCYYLFCCCLCNNCCSEMDTGKLLADDKKSFPTLAIDVSITNCCTDEVKQPSQTTYT